MSTRRLAARALGLVLPLTVAGCGAGTPAERPAVVLITCDTLRADRLGFHGYGRGTSPNLDRLAQESLVFEAAWSTAPLTGPALSALMTGRMPDELGLEDNRTLLSGAAVTLAERLAAEGVETGAVVSNWVLRRRPELADAGLQQGFAHYDDRMEASEPARPELKERLAPDTTDAALAWLVRRGTERSFFLWVHYQDPHGPYTAPRELLEPPLATDGEPELEVGADQRGKGVLPAYQAVDDERRPAQYRARYEAEIRFFDRELGRLVDGLRARGLLDRALLVFTADHGESLGEHGFFFSHGQHLHRELVHVPLLLRPPGGDPSPRRVAAPASHLDLFPTVLAHFGLAPGATRGVDLVRATPPLERVVPQFLRGTWSTTGAQHRLLAEGGARRLFDLATDPAEERDLAASRPELVRALTEAHRAFVRSIEPAGLAAVRPEKDAADAEVLDALGYGGGDEVEED